MIGLNKKARVLASPGLLNFKSGGVLLISSPGSESQIANFRLQISPWTRSGDRIVPSALEALPRLALLLRFADL